MRINCPDWIFRSRLAAVVLLILACLATGAAQVGAQNADALEQLQINRRKWQSKEIKNYKFHFNWICFCGLRGRPFIITVRDGKVEDVRYAEGEQRPIEPEHLERFKTTVDELFDLVQQAIKRKAYRINVSYDPELGYPKLAFIDYHRNIVDEELGFRIENFVVNQ